MPKSRELVDQLVQALAELPDTTTPVARLEALQPDNRRADAEIDLDVSGERMKLLVELKKSAFPRDVRGTLWQLKRYSGFHGTRTEPIVPMIVAESISTGAKALLRAERVGYFDSGGSLFIPAPRAYILIEKPEPRSLVRHIRSVFTGRRAQVLRALLSTPREWVRVKDLAARAQVSAGTASETLGELERFDWVISRGAGPAKERLVKEPGQLLDAWAREVTAMKRPAGRRFYVPIANADELVERLAGACEMQGVEYAITAEAAAQRYAPFLTRVSQVRCRVAKSPAVNEVLAALQAREVDEGFNLVVIDTGASGELLFRQYRDGVWLAHPVQVYLDLLGREGRTKELAEHLRRECMGF